MTQCGLGSPTKPQKASLSGLMVNNYTSIQISHLVIFFTNSLTVNFESFYEMQTGLME